MFFSQNFVISAPDLIAGPRARTGEDGDSICKRRRFSSDNELESFPYAEEQKSVFNDYDILV